MGQRRSLTILPLLAACATAPAGQPKPMPPPNAAQPPAAGPQAPETPEGQVVAEFEHAVKTGFDAYVGLFDFAAVGELEILLHRYDLWGRLPNLADDIKAQFAAEDGTPYPAERERKNVGKFYDPWIRNAVGSGGCTPRVPRTRYAKKLGIFEPLPAGTPEKYEELRAKANAYVGNGGVVAFACSGRKEGIVVVWTKRPNARGFDLVTLYMD